MKFLHKLFHFLGIKSDLHKMLLQNTIWGVAGESISRLIAAVLVVFVARYLGALRYGEFQFAMSFCVLFIFLLNLGFPNLMIREIAREKSLVKKYVENLFVIKGVLAIVSFAVVAFIASLIDKPLHVKWLIVLAMLVVILMSFEEFIYCVFIAFDWMKVRAIGRISLSILLLILGLYAIFTDRGAEGIMLAYVFSAGIVAFALFVAVQILITRFFVQFDFRFWKEITIKMLPFGLFAFIFTVYSKIDMVMLSFLKGDEAVGIYAAGFNIYAALQMIPMLLVQAVYPTLSRAFVHSKMLLRKLYGQYFWIVLGLGSIIGLSLAILGKFIVVLLFGESFSATVHVVQYFGLSFIFAALLLFYSFFFASIDEQKTYLKVLVLGSLLGIILNYLFIPRFSYVGAVIGTVGAQIYNVAVLFFIMRKKGYRVFQ